MAWTRLVQAAVVAAAAAVHTAVATTSTLYPHVPLLMWSERSTFTKGSYLAEELDVTSVVETFKRIADGAIGSEYTQHILNDKREEPVSELLCVFLRQNLELGDLNAGAYLASAFNADKSSVVIPQTTRMYSLTSTAKPDELPNTVVPLGSLETFLKGDGSSLLNNHKTDVIFVKLPADVKDVDQTIKDAVEVLKKETNGLVDFALTGDEAEPTQFTSRRLAAKKDAPIPVCEPDYKLGFSNGKAFCFPHYVRATPEVMAGILFGFFFLFLSYVGLSVLNAIQTPTRYPLHGPPKGKEF
ncbi:TPA: hypothetical protein N0F65_011923 [Lagenidium giganteum]|uniref:Protein BIG1 n=1 Tax=Lagenidium giganteum TaxID=4803 RepID=A0AAV2YTA3_9STRA|nr:TPA: hypothetical protein N0F65_011923 [Lagenidium giganteum]